MSRKKHKLTPFVPLTWKMLNSIAYKELSSSSAKALPFFLGKGKVKHTLQEFTFSYTEANKKLGFGKNTFKRIIDDLIEKGFIQKTALGGLRGYEKSYNKYKLAEKWLIYRTLSFWGPLKQPTSIITIPVEDQRNKHSTQNDTCREDDGGQNDTCF